VVFVGRLHGNNLHCVEQFIQRGWPIVRRNHPGAELHLVGAAIPEVERSLRKHAGAGIVLRGYVNQLTDAYVGADVSLSPIDKDSGVLNKTIEAMAAGVPVVSFASSLQGLIEGDPGFDIPSGATYEELGEQVAKFLADPESRRLASTKNRSYAKANYSWDSRCEHFQKMYKGAILARST